ncbi:MULTISPECIES: MFS transporter [unclassified Beijerinckia]|uniref:MFS transporter n=1 Tax=unclassified Beijerinckia TaxID=2638183 RepID=UPI000895A8FE|nr:MULTISPECIES: MFS transporter [unclassified Beijerinckia]MDH7799019.1 MFS family permease [Beijerinckia sp. GAS462]SED84163.1 Predicted arabinose efflux permease, MFS family [Beijerinckia sp. 28-YEA-48]
MLQQNETLHPASAADGLQQEVKQDSRFLTPSRQWWLVICLTLFSTLAYIDKNIIVLMMHSIQTDLGLTFTQTTLAVGTAFAVANVLMVLPAGWMADHYSRRSVVAAAVALWSLMAILCGVASNFLTLFLVRAGVGLAEGLLPPSSYSLIRDGVSPSRHGRAFSVFGMSILVGTGLAFVVGGLLIGYVVTHDFSGVPLIGHMKPWAIAIALVGLAGFPLALLAFTFPEPQRGASIKKSEVSFNDIWRFIGKERAILIPLAGFSVAHAMLTNSLNLWVPPLLNLRFGLTPAQIGFPLGMLLLIAGPIGLLITGYFIDKFDATGRYGSAIIAVVVSVPLALLGIAHALVPTLNQFWVVQGSLLLFASAYLVVTSTVVARLAPSAMMGRLIAFYLVVQGVLGIGVAPTLTALTVEHVFVGTAQPIPTSMATVHGLYGLLGFVCAVLMYMGFRRREDLGKRIVA